MWTLTQRRKLFAPIGALIVASLGSVRPLLAQTVTTMVSAGNLPFAVAVNPVTNKVYVASYSGSSVTVMDGATDATTTVNVGALPEPLKKKALSNVESGTMRPGAGNTWVDFPVGGSTRWAII